MMKKGTFLAFAAILAVVQLACSRPAASVGIVFSGTVETHEIQVGSKVGGRVKEVLAVEGQLVKAGDPLVKFDLAELEAERKQLEARLAQAQAALTKLEAGFRPQEIAEAEAASQRERSMLDMMKKGPRSEEINQARAELAAATAEATNADTTFHRYERLHAGGDVSKQALDDARAKRDAAARNVEALRARLTLLETGYRAEEVKAAEERYNQAREHASMMRAGSRSEDIAQARAQVNEVKALLEQNAVRLAEGVVTASTDARIEVLSVRPGDLMTPGKPVAVLLEEKQLWVRIFVPEPDLGRIAVGQKAAVKVDTYTDRTFPGQIEHISAQAEFLPRNIQSRNERNHQVFGVKVRVDDPQGVLKSGMAAEVTLLETK